MEFKYIGFIGCYTKPGQADPFESSHGGIPHDRYKIGRGVLAIGVDASGRLSYLNDGEPVIAADDLPNPSYLSFNGRSGEDGRLYVVSETEEGKWQPFRVTMNNISGKMELAAAGELRSTMGSYPCHITHATTSGGSDLVFISNYGEDVGVFSVMHNDKCQHVMFGSGSKANLTRQQTSHAHSACVAPSVTSNTSIDVCAVDLGSDSIIQFRLSPTSDSLELKECGRLAAPSGSGPRSLMFNPNQALRNIAIVSLEMTAEVWLIRQRPHDGCLEGLDSPISLLPERWPNDFNTESQFNNGRWASDAIWSPDGKFVYAAARLHDSISVFKLNYKVDDYRQPSSGEGCPNSIVVQNLELVHQIKTEGRTPRCLAMSECGEFLLVAHQHSHDVSSFRRCSDDGNLTFVNKLDANCAACVKLVQSDIFKK